MAALQRFRFMVVDSDRQRQILERDSLRRLFCAVGGIPEGDGGRVARADVRFFDFDGEDGTGQGEWMAWEPGRTLYWKPFELRLEATPRAGLHVTSSWRDSGGSMRYGSNFKVRENGVFVMNPSSVTGLAEPLGRAIADPDERRLIEDTLAYVWNRRGGVPDLLSGTRLPEGCLREPDRTYGLAV